MRFGIIRCLNAVTNHRGDDAQWCRTKLVVAKLRCHWLLKISCIMESSSTRVVTTLHQAHYD